MILSNSTNIRESYIHHHDDIRQRNAMMSRGAERALLQWSFLACSQSQSSSPPGISKSSSWGQWSWYWSSSWWSWGKRSSSLWCWWGWWLLSVSLSWWVGCFSFYPGDHFHDNDCMICVIIDLSTILIKIGTIMIILIRIVATRLWRCASIRSCYPGPK